MTELGSFEAGHGIASVGSTNPKRLHAQTLTDNQMCPTNDEEPTSYCSGSMLIDRIRGE